MKKYNLQETLVSLYLRLNGYFVSGFIVHAPGDGGEGNRTQVDALAVRFPYNSEPERQVRPSEYLQLSTELTDILFCEVKGGKAPLQFNHGLQDSAVVRKVLRWIGAFDPEQVEGLLQPVREILSPREADTRRTFRTVSCQERKCQIRAMLFALDRPAPRPNQTRYVPGQEIVGFINSCLRTHAPREACTTQYDFGLWGGLYEPIVRVIKDADHDVGLHEIYDAFLDADGPNS
jgi:hypothetical protein